MLVSVFALTSLSANAAVIQAMANSTGGGVGFSTGLFFNAGDFFTSTADENDLWNAGVLPRWSNADGLRTNLYATGSDDSGQ